MSAKSQQICENEERLKLGEDNVISEWAAMISCQFIWLGWEWGMNYPNVDSGRPGKWTVFSLARRAWSYKANRLDANDPNWLCIDAWPLQRLSNSTHPQKTNYESIYSAASRLRAIVFRLKCFQTDETTVLWLAERDHFANQIHIPVELLPLLLLLLLLCDSIIEMSSLKRGSGRRSSKLPFNCNSI